jgi:hypothetical protein
MFVDLSNPSVLQEIQASGFEPDGTISFNTSDVMFEMVWQRPQDYNLATGLADPFSKSKAQSTRKGIQSRVYQASTCVSEFRQGRFEQTIKGILKMFPVPGATNTKDTSKDNQSKAEENRLREANEKAKGRSSGLTDKEAQQARADFAARDPRRADSPDSGRAAAAGAQQGSPKAKGATTVNNADPRQGRILTNSTSGAVNPSTLLPAGPPRPASSGGNSGTVGTVGTTTENVGSAPPKMPAAGAGQGTLTTQQRRDVAAQQRAVPNSNPVSSSVPSNQKIAKDY